jgi:SET domain
LGLFIRAKVTEYGCLVRSAIEARALPPDLRAWLRTLTSQHLEIDGNPSIPVNGGPAVMATKHTIGSFFNHSTKGKNCEFQKEEWTSQSLVDTHGRPGPVKESLFLRATRDIFPHEQLLVDYGSQADGFFQIPF